MGCLDLLYYVACQKKKGNLEDGMSRFIVLCCHYLDSFSFFLGGGWAGGGGLIA